MSAEAIRHLHELFELSVDNHPQNIAILCDDHILTYQELDYRSNQLAHYLISLGIESQHYVGVFLERSLESYIAILAILKTGASYVPIEVEYPDERVNYILSDINFHSVITSSSQWLNRSIQSSESGQSSSLINPIIIDQLKAQLAQQIITRPKKNSHKPEKACYVIYTSGSTGKPKGVEVSHSNICHYVSAASQIYRINHTDRVYQGFSLGFDASLEELWMAFANAATLVAGTEKDLRSGIGLIEFLNNNQVTVLSTVPSLLGNLEGDLSSLRLLILGGESCSPKLIKDWSRDGLKIMNTYGPTEATVVSTYAECEVGKPITIGKPLPGYEVLILDEKLQEVHFGEQGELCIAGKGIATGYVNQVEQTHQKFINHTNGKRFYRTGDLVRLDSNGNLIFLGRIDNQVKLRGFRIELNEIEKIIEEYPPIKQAIVTLWELDQPLLVAYVSAKKNQAVDIEELKDFLQKKLPHYMYPAAFQVLESFPTLSSGKIDRKKLPRPEGVFQQGKYYAPKTSLEKKIKAIWEDSLKAKTISVTADFFYDLGGHSLIAANIVSNLRKLPEMEHISILDLYQNSTIRGLAKKFGKKDKHDPQNNTTSDKNPSSRKINQTSNLSYYLCGIGQFFGGLLQYAMSAWQLLVVILCYEWLSMDSVLTAKALFIFFMLFISMPLVSLTFTICAKWLLVGRIKPGNYKVWGWFYFRWWLVERLQRNVFSAKHLIGSPLIILYYRLLGAKVGKNCFIASANFTVQDSISIGDNTSIGLDARLLGYVVEDGWLRIGTITIGNNCFVGSRCVLDINTIIEDEGKLDDMSMLPTQNVIPSKAFFSGSPAASSIAPADHITNQISNVSESGFIKNTVFCLLHYFGLVAAIVVYYLCYFPALLLIIHFSEKTHYLLTLFVAAPLGAVVFLSLYYLCMGICKKLLISKTKPGIYPLKSLYYLRQWIIIKMIDIEEVYIMADTLYFPYFLRFLGAKLGKHVELGEIPHVIPDLVTIQDGGFIASAAALAWPNIYLGFIKFAPVNIGKKGFIGNMGLLPPGANLGKEGLLGCMSITPPNNQAANDYTAWLGSPAMFLPKRELFTEFSDSEKYTPSKRLFTTRLAIEFARIIMPTTLTLIVLFNLLFLSDILFAKYSLAAIIGIFPLAECVITLGVVISVVVSKWIIVGRVKPAAKPIWNIFIWKNDLIEYIYNFYIHPHFISLFLGTPFFPILLRAFGAKIGKKVFINTYDFTEFDLIKIGDQAYINHETIIQTHLYEDRIFKMSNIEIKEGCNIGVASIVLYSTVMEPYSTLGNFSLLMKGESLPKNTSWQGVPAQPMKNISWVNEGEPWEYLSDPSLVQV